MFGDVSRCASGQLFRIGVSEMGLCEAIVQKKVHAGAKVCVHIQIHSFGPLFSDLDIRRCGLPEVQIVADDMIERQTRIDAAAPSLPAMTDFVVARRLRVQLGAVGRYDCGRTE